MSVCVVAVGVLITRSPLSATDRVAIKTHEASITPTAATFSQCALANRDVKILPAGDSITEGYYTHPGGYRIALFRSLSRAGVRVDFTGPFNNGEYSQLPDGDHGGITGATIDDLAQFIGDWVAIRQPDIVLLLIGVNDIGAGEDMPVVVDRMNRLLQKIYLNQPNADVRVATLLTANKPEWWQARRDEFNNALIDIVVDHQHQAHKIALVDMHDVLAIDDLYDELHPNWSGYAKLGNAWTTALCNPQFTSTPTPTATPIPQKRYLIALPLTIVN